nr:hypothetical protein [Tanacetum cinerariifolium]
MSDKKNSVLFTDTECLVLSPDYKLPDESQVPLRVPKENNMYNVNLQNIVPSRDLTCLFAKATIDESNLWHRRELKGNLVYPGPLSKMALLRGRIGPLLRLQELCWQIHYYPFYFGLRQLTLVAMSRIGTNPISAAGPSNINTSPTHRNSLLQDASQPPNMLESEDIVYSDHENVGAEADFIKKFGLTEGKSASTPIDTEKPLLKDPDGEDVDVHIYRSMIGSLMYLTLSRPDIMFT